MLGYEPVVALNVLECNPERPAFRHRIACIDRQVQQCRFGIRGLYLAGSGAHPGGGITGAPGANAAREVLADLKRRGASGARP